MEENNLDIQESLTTEESEETSTPQEEPVVDASQVNKLEELYKNQKVRAEKAEAERKALEEKLNKLQQSDVKAKGLDIGDYIDISASLEGLDQREKEYLAKEHKLTGKPLSEIRQDEDFKLWQSAYKQKVEKEVRAMAPTSTQTESERPTTLTEKLASARTIAEKQKILEEAGLYKENRPRADRANIGLPMGR